jgi:hypothetical protein
VPTIMTKRVRVATAGLMLWLLGASTARAGMPMPVLSEVARMRSQAISFFLVVFLASAWVIQRLWNGLRGDVPRLPRLSYPRAVGVVTLWGLLFLLVLTMISGARELMTPGAWRKEGLTYRLVEKEPRPEPLATTDRDRREAIDRLRVALWTYARGHGGTFPPDASGTELLDELWQVPGPSGARYLYRGGQSLHADVAPLAFEPEVFDRDRLVLMTSGAVRTMSSKELDNLLAEDEP